MKKTDYSSWGTSELIEELESRDRLEGRNDERIREFKVSTVTREDLEYAGFSHAGVTDETMDKLASRMGMAYIESGAFSDSLTDIALDLGIKES